MIVRMTLLVATLTLAGCASAQRNWQDMPAEVEHVLDDFHAAAAEGDANRYLAHFADNGVFFGTDATERWTVQQFEPYVRRGFADGGWTYVPRDRTVFINHDDGTAWFDEMLDGSTGIVARGTGVLVRDGDRWRVAQYNFSVPFPNSLWDTINAMIAREAVAPAAQPARAPIAARPEDVATPQAIVDATYDSFGRAPGQHIQWDRFRTLFHPSARLIPNEEQTGGEMRVLSAEDFIAWIDEVNARVVGTERDRGFQEVGVHAVVEQYGDIAHVMSTYVKHFHNDTRVLGRGINSFQLIRRENRWWIVGIVWDEENGAGPVPERYLP